MKFEIVDEFVSYSADETFEFGCTFGRKLKTPALICLFGELAAGKTTFLKGLAFASAGIPTVDVQSPTFTYLNIYEGWQKFYHFDLYRLKNIDEFISMGFDEYFYTQSICCIEWSERIEEYLPTNSIFIRIAHRKENQRTITTIKCC